MIRSSAGGFLGRFVNPRALYITLSRFDERERNANVYYRAIPAQWLNVISLYWDANLIPVNIGNMDNKGLDARRVSGIRMLKCATLHSARDARYIRSACSVHTAHSGKLRKRAFACPIDLINELIFPRLRIINFTRDVKLLDVESRCQTP